MKSATRAARRSGTVLPGVVPERGVHLLAGVLAHRQLEVPALVAAADAPPQRDPVLDEVEIIGVEVGGAQMEVPGWAGVAPSGRPPRSGSAKSALGVVLLLGLQVIPVIVRHGLKASMVDGEPGARPLDDQRVRAGPGRRGPDRG